ncbi:hypothetical protein [Nocardia sp. NPDC004711]
MAEPAAYVYLSETALPLTKSAHGRAITSAARNCIAVETFTIRQDGWLLARAILSPAEADAEGTADIWLPPHTVAGIVDAKAQTTDGSVPEVWVLYMRPSSLEFVTGLTI